MLDAVLTPDATARLAAADAFLFDMDGTLVLGDKRNEGAKPLPGAVEILNYLHEADIPFATLTNGSAHTPAAYFERLTRAGLPVKGKEILTPPAVAAEYFRRRKYRRILVLGCEGVWRPLADLGLEVVLPADMSGSVDAVFTGWYREFTIRDLEIACEAIWDGARLYTASDVPFFATANGRGLGTSSAINAAIKNATGKRAKVLGKPSKEALKCAAGILGVKPESIAVVGDDPLLEMRMAKSAGALAVAVTTGLTTEAEMAEQKQDRRPDLIFKDVGGLLTALKTAKNSDMHKNTSKRG